MGFRKRMSRCCPKCELVWDHRVHGRDCPSCKVDSFFTMNLGDIGCAIYFEKAKEQGVTPLSGYKEYEGVTNNEGNSETVVTFEEPQVFHFDDTKLRELLDGDK